jgi:transposase
MSSPTDGRTAEVVRLHYLEGLSIRSIATRLGMARKTIRVILGRRLPRATTTLRASRGSLLDPFDDHIRQMLDDTPELKAPAMLERLRARGYAGGISILRERMRVARPKPAAEAFLTLEFAPGSAMQVDWADFGFALPGVPRRVSAFVATLCYSRHLYLEFTVSQQMGTFLRCMDRALQFFGGTANVDIFDNMRTVVLERARSLVVFNPRMLEYARVRGSFAVVACNPRRGNEKGIVERGIGFVRSRFWPGRRFATLFDLNAQATAWRDDFANGREHEVTGRIPRLVFENEERPLLKGIPDVPFDSDDLLSTGVNKSFRVRFDRNSYSVPWRLVSQSVLVRANDDEVSVWLGPKRVAVHPRSWTVGEDVEHPSHKKGLLELKPRGRAGDLPPALADLGGTGASYFKLLAAGSRSIRREIIRLTLLCELFGHAETRSALDEVMRTGHVGADYVEYVLRHKRKLVPSVPHLRLGKPELDEIHVSEPDMSVYDELGAAPNPQSGDDP